jgi:HTH-type transcriptional regulator/antitoxin HigA
MQIRPIQNESDHDAALARIAALMSAAELGSAQGAELDALVTLVDAYEDKHHPMDAPTPIAVIEFYLDQNGLTRKDLEPLIGSRARVFEIMTGKRPLTIPMIQRLRDQFGISADVLIAMAQPHKSRTSSRKKSPQDKKALSLQRDRRNTYGENAKSSRKNIPRSKQLSQRAMRRATNSPLQGLHGIVSEDLAVDTELKSRIKGIEKNRSRFKKWPDKPLGKVLEKKRIRNARKAS